MNFVVMLKIKSIVSVLFVLNLIVSIPACKNDSRKRYISETDTTYSEDIRSITKKINENPDNAELYYKRANTFFFERNFKQATADIDYAIALDSTKALYDFLRAKSLISGDTANSREAIMSFKKALRLQPDYIEAMLEYGKLLIARQMYDEAEKIYVACNRKDPSNPQPYFYLGLMAKEMQDTLKAVTLFEKTLVYDGNYYDAVMQLGNYYAVSGNDKALVFFDRAIRLNPYSDEALYAKGLFLQKKQLYKDAAALYEEVYKMNPGHILCRYNLAYINALFNNYDKALKLLDETISLANNYAEAYALRGLVREKMNDKMRAADDYRKALELDETLEQAKAGMKRVS